MDSYELVEFKLQCPKVDEEGTEFEFTEDKRIIAILRTGEAIEYDLITKSFRSAMNIDILLRKKKPKTESEWRILFGRRMYRQMKLCGFNQDDISMQTGISIANVSKYLDGLVTPSAYKVRLIADALHCTTDFLIDI